VCNELLEVTKLINFLQLHINPDDEIVVQYDETAVTSEVLAYLNIADKMEARLKVVGFPLNKDFASFKNNLTKHSTKDYILSIDADEIPHENLVELLGQVLDTNPVDLVFVPRINTVDGITEHHVKKYGWKITKIESDTLIHEKVIDIDSAEYQLLKKYDLIIEETHSGLVKYYRPVNQFPDYQTRLYRRTDDIEWQNKVHERITGYNNFSNFPAKEEWCIYHHKSIDRQIVQNNFYETI